MLIKTRWHRFINLLHEMVVFITNPLRFYSYKLDEEYDNKLKEHSTKEMQEFIQKMGGDFERALEEQELRVK